MPTPSAKTVEAREMFKRDFLGKNHDLKVIRTAIQGKVGFSNPWWYRLRKEFMRDIQSYRGATLASGPAEQAEMPALDPVMTIPSNLDPTAKEAFNRLLSHVNGLEHKLDALRAENASLATSASQEARKLRIIKKIAADLIEAV